MSGLLLDTCAIIWVAENEELSDAAMSALSDAASKSRTVWVSPISAWEVGLLVARERLVMRVHPRQWFSSFIELPGIGLSEMKPDILIDSSFLPGDPPRDPADRIVIATARARSLSIVTRDKLILRYAEAGHVAAIAC